MHKRTFSQSNLLFINDTEGDSSSIGSIQFNYHHHHHLNNNNNNTHINNNSNGITIHTSDNNHLNNNNSSSSNSQFSSYIGNGNINRPTSPPFFLSSSALSSDSNHHHNHTSIQQFSSASALFSTPLSSTTPSSSFFQPIKNMLDIESQGNTSPNSSSTNNKGNVPFMTLLQTQLVKNKRILYPLFIGIALIAIGLSVVLLVSSGKSSSSSLEASILPTHNNAHIDASVLLKGKSVSPQSSRTEFPILLVADRDKASKVNDEKKGTLWKSVLVRGLLKRNEQTGEYSLSVNGKPMEIVGQLVEGSRGMELSELKMYNGKLYSADDRTGIVYQIMVTSSGNNGDIQVKAIPRHILPDGNGETTSKGFKCEWATVKDNKLYIGSIGKEWTTGDGVVLNHDPMYVKTIDANGKVEHVDWIKNYKALLRAVGIKDKGYMVHEAAEWSEFHKRWFFLPRRVSFESYDEKKDEQRGSNYVISASEDFSHIEFARIGDIISPARGFSSVKFIPGRPTEMIAVKSEETDEAIRSYLMVFDISTGKVLMPETLIIDEKIEGMEIA
ncbi:hypothetical protein FDP41_013730 [Naegleria fowleri]|uniref:Apyrase n=1 Tax=Naegleria fowleri TaxID=5763 RepID=A0A6A5BYQ1_NAEFO|nr:uncharacterized protein FDP41_013730 [Naegleria fowleri]KAF0980516.1 hypothetical protein FDP41_013730 [Naegleria fowleri]